MIKYRVFLMPNNLEIQLPIGNYPVVGQMIAYHNYEYLVTKIEPNPTADEVVVYVEEVMHGGEF